MQRCALREEDIPGATLGGCDASTLTIPALERWLQSRAAPTNGRKAELGGKVSCYC